MDPKALIPVPDAIPVPWGWFEALSLVTFALHLILMNVVLGGAAVALAEQVRGRYLDLSQDLSKRLPVILGLVVNLGVPPLLFVQVAHGNFLYASSVLMGAYWLALIATVMLAYALLYVWDFRFGRMAPAARTLCLGAALVLLAASAFILVTNMSLMIRPEAWPAYFENAKGTLLNLGDPTFLPRYLHFLLAALAVGGLFTALSARLKARKEGDGFDPGPRVALGLSWFTRATMLQMAAGLWWFVALPAPVRAAFMGGHGPGTAVFLASLALGLAALFAGLRGNLPAACWLAAATILAMAGMRAVLRAVTLAPYQTLGSLKVTGEYSPLFVFLAVFVLGLAALGYLISLYRRAGKEG